MQQTMKQKIMNAFEITTAIFAFAILLIVGAVFLSAPITIPLFINYFTELGTLWVAVGAILGCGVALMTFAVGYLMNAISGMFNF